MKGPVHVAATPVASIFGKNESVLSLIWVTACKAEVSTPAARAASNGGPHSFTVSSVAACRKAIASKACIGGAEACEPAQIVIGMMS